MRRLAIPLLLAALLIGCSSGTGRTGTPGLELARSSMARASADPAAAADAATAIDAFGLDLYGRLGTAPDNFVLSPTSIALALSMARVGARGATADEMDLVLGGLGSDARAAALTSLDAALAGRTGTYPDSTGKGQPVTLDLANALFAQRDLPLAPSFLDALSTRFDSGTWLVDFKADPDAARQAINGWVDGATGHRIRTILNPGDVTTDWRLALANAIHLKAAWLTPFETSATAPADFVRPDGSVVAAPTMHGRLDVPYAAGSGWQAVQLPYVGPDLALLVILPDDLASFRAGLSAASLAAVSSGLAPRPVDLALPTFALDARVDLGDVLAAMGMVTAFSDRADFSGITTAESLFIAQVAHEATISVDEAGTEAAAATVVGIGATSLPANPVTVDVNRPFLFVLRDVPSGAVLFLGQVVDPTARA